MEPEPLKLPAADGLSLAGLEWSREGVPMVFLHGFGNDAHVWDQICPSFASYYRTLAITLRGHGDSDWDEQARYDHASMARDLSCALDSLGFERIVLVGHSMGARVSMRFAGEHPERLAGLVIIDAGPELDARGVTRIRLEAQSGPASFATVDEYRRLLAQHYPAAEVATLDRLAEHWTRQQPDGRFALKLDPKLRGMRSDLDPTQLEAAMAAETEALWAALKGLPCAALVVRGAASDVFDPDTADRMVDEVMSNARLAVVPRAGHSVMLDNPAGLIEALSDFALA